MKQMQEIAISVFKAKCLSIIDQVEKTKSPVRITRHGKPVADVVPTVPDVERAALFGCMRDSIEILGDIVSPVIDLNEIEALRD